jgi:hypothetical protein
VIGEEITDGIAEFSENEWWIKSLRASGRDKGYDFPSHVVRVSSTTRVDYRFALDGELVLRDSPRDPYTDLLPMRELVSAEYIKTTMDLHTRSSMLAGPLDQIAYWGLRGHHWRFTLAG